MRLGVAIVVLLVGVIVRMAWIIGKMAWIIAEDFEEGWRDNDQDND